MSSPRRERKGGSLLAVTLGDVNGIGPEVALKAAFHPGLPVSLRLVLIGCAGVLREQAELLGLPVPPAWNPGMERPLARVVCWDPGTARRLPWKPGRITAPASRAAMAWIAAGTEGCLNGRFDGLVTAPICKEGLRKAGMDWPGHTEYLAHLTGTRRFAMLLTGGRLRVALATRHLPLRHVAEHLTRPALDEIMSLTCEALEWLGAGGRRVGVCGLNPHAGDGGTLGSEERDLIAPAVRAARRRGLPVEGPVPSDIIFYQARHGRYDAVIAMYHDQGLAPLKMLAFDQGVNITLGLPIVRTSPDHGTAFDLAGRGVARQDSMLTAIRLAARLARRAHPWPVPHVSPASGSHARKGCAGASKA